MSQLGYTQGSGSEIKTDQGSTTGAHMQVIKLAEGTAGSENLIPATVSKGVLVEVSQIDAAVTISGTPEVTISGTPAVVVSSVSGTVEVAGTVALSGTSAVSGTVTGNQGSPATTANAWPVKVTDGTNPVHLTEVGSNYSVDVNVTQSATLPGTQADKSGFTEGTGLADVVAAVYNDSPVSSPAANQAAALRITPNRALHMNLRNQSGTELGTSGAPVRIDPVGTTTQPVSGTVTAEVKDASGTAFSASNPLPTQPQPYSTNFWTQHLAFTASETAVAVHTPPSGKTAYVLGFILTPTAAGAIFKLFDNTDSDTSELFNGQPPAICIPVTYPVPRPLSAINNVLRYSTGASAAGDIVVWGYDA